MSKKIAIGLLICSIGLLIVCGAKVVPYFMESKEAASDYKRLQAIRDDSGYLELKTGNSDLVGWLKIKGTPMDYPVLYNASDPEYYLHRNFDKEYSAQGSLFVDMSTDMRISKNLLIYGHHMADGSMFHDLDKYADKTYYKKHKYVLFDQVTTHTVKKGKYAVMAAFYAETDNNPCYLDFANVADEETFQKYIKLIKQRAEYDTGITPEWGDELITLSTCSYHVPRPRGRFAVVAVKTN